MKKSTKIIGGIILLSTGIGVYLINKKPTLKKGHYLDDNPETGISIKFSPTVIANQLYEAMRGMGTDEDVIFETLTGLTQNQFGSVVKAFGLKSYNRYTGNQKGIIGIDLPKYGLKTWLRYELSEKQYKTLRYKFPNHL